MFLVSSAHFLTKDRLLMGAGFALPTEDPPGIWVLWNHGVVEQALEELTQFTF